MERIVKGSLNGYFYEGNKKLNIIAFGGSEGKCNCGLSEKLNGLGYNVFTTTYFSKDNQPKILEKISIDFFDEVLALLEYKNILDYPLVVVGGSKGAELSLLLSTLYEEIKGVVVYTPSFYCFQGVNPNNKVSSWMFKGKEIPYIKYKMFTKSGLMLLKDMLLKKKLVLRKMYEDAIKHAKNKEEARIKIEKSKAKYLMFAGDDDQMWPSDTMILEMLNYRSDIQYKIYKGVGHVFGGDVQNHMHYFGGNKEKNMQADDDALKIAGEFIESFMKESDK